jgi:2-polyprenyl-3-methyl-5-hydroxy-6-metoxy-1,4-benzoquinol methylase
MPPLRERANAGLHDHVFQYIQSTVQPSPANAMLDIGCGSGAWLQRFQQAGFTNLMGIDLDTQQFALENIPTQAMNLDDYNGQVLGNFSFITALELIEHLENPGLLFKLVSNNLQQGGDFIISTPNIQGLPARLRFLYKNRLNHFDDKSDPTHIYPVYTENLQRVLPRHGLRIHAMSSFPEKGYMTYRGITKQLAGLAGVFFPDNVPGDNTIYWIKKV